MFAPKPLPIRQISFAASLMLLFSMLVSQPTPAAEQSAFTSDRPSIGLVLSGGGARGGAHIGVLKVLDELRIPVDYIAGTSMGAIVGGLYAAGLSAEQLEDIVIDAEWSNLLTDRPPRSQLSFRRKGDEGGFLVDFDLGISKRGLILPAGFLQGQNLELALKRNVLPVMTINDFDRLPIPFRAVATDIVTGEAVALGSGNLATAMRASMSAPGIFKPVKLDGRMLVDGGVANNLPVQIVKDMGAEVLIVVDVGFPLLPEAELESALDVTKQMLTILINARAREQVALLGPRDVLITPELGNLKSEAFDRLADARRLGEEKSRSLLDRLATLSVSDSAYATHRASIAARLRSPPVIDTVVVKNESRLAAEVIQTRLSEHRGQPLNVDLLEANIVDIYGFNTFENVTYDITRTSQGNELTIKSTERSWGPNYLRLGINLEDNFEGDSRYNVAARFTQTEINRKGGELRAEIQLGESPRVFAEWFQPLDYASRWFINPQLAFQRQATGLFTSGRQLARIQSDEASLVMDAGRQFKNWGELRFGISRTFNNSKLLVGDLPSSPGTTDLTLVQSSFAYDTIDSVAIPRHGTTFALSWAGARQSLDSDASFDIASLFLLKPYTWGKNTLLHWWDFGSTVNDKTAGIQPFSLGGLFSLSGYAPDELSGRHAGIGRLLYYRRLGGQALRVLDTEVYAGASIEAGNVWQASSDISFNDTLVAGSLFLAFDTVIGPLYVAYGMGEGGRESAYLFLGQTF